MTHFNDNQALREMRTAYYELKEKTPSLPPVCQHIPLFDKQPASLWRLSIHSSVILLSLSLSLFLGARQEPPWHVK